MILLMTIQRLTTIDPWLQPHADALQQRVEYVQQVEKKICNNKELTDFALGHLYFGLHRTPDGWVLREWAPHAATLYMIGEFSEWRDDQQFAAARLADGVWELTLPADALAHGDLYKLHIYWDGGDGYRVPAWATRAVQDPATKEFNAQVWQSTYRWHDDSFTPATAPLMIYEAHVGMSSQRPAVASYADFTRDVLPRIVAAGYTAIQLMAIQEHPYYGSFGYHVSSFFAASSRFGTPDDLKALVDAAHQAGLAVILDLVHSHAVKNEVEGLSRFDGSYTQYFHDGPRGNHDQWDSRVFDYGKPQVLHFLLSNCRYWLDEYHFDGFRFDGVTSMLYRDHGMGRSFDRYDDYFRGIDPDALAYLTLANKLIHAVKPRAITIAEDMSGMPGLCAPPADGGNGFDYRLSMGVPDLWIKLIKHARDEDWRVSQLYHELCQHRPEERTISYAESHDQALVGDQTLMFRLAGRDMYDHMQIGDNSVAIDRAVALHKMIRLLTASTNSGGYLNFMGNEFGHPEWIDFPRQGNGWSYDYARRQWQLADDPGLKYQWLGEFDRAMIDIVKHVDGDDGYVTANDDDQVLAYMRGDLLFVYNFHPSRSFPDYGVAAAAGHYAVILSSDDPRFGGFGRVDTGLAYTAHPDLQLPLYLPARTALVLRKQ